MTSHRDFTHRAAPMARLMAVQKNTPSILWTRIPSFASSQCLSPPLVNLSPFKRRQSPFRLSSPASGHPRSRLSKEIRNISECVSEVLVVTLRDACA